MKNTSINLLLGFVLGLSILLFYSCGHDHGAEGHAHNPDGSHPETTTATTESNHHAGHDDHTDHEAHGGHAGHDDHDDHEKTVTLNEAQYTNAGIDTGWFDMKNLSDVVHANGYTKLDPRDQAEVSVVIRGIIQSIDVIEGDYVRKGETIASMLSLDFNTMLLDKAKLQEEVNVAQAKLIYLQQEYDRQKVLSEELVTAKKLFQKVSGEIQVERAKIQSVNQQIAILEQTIGLINDQRSPNINITAPINGYITDVAVKIGSAAEVGKTLFSMVDNSKMHVDLLVYEKDLNKVKAGQNVRFILTNQSNKEIKGKIYNIGQSFENDTKSVAVHADINRGKTKLIPGMYLNALIDIGSSKVETLPVEAVVMAEGREFIFLWEKENLKADGHDHKDHEGHDHPKEITFARLEVKTGASQLGRIHVTPLGKIHDGDKIVKRGAYYLQSHLQKSEGGGGHGHAH